MSRVKKSLLVVGLAGIVAVGGATAAIAYWSASGSGSGTATTGTSTAFTVNSTTSATPLLTPGGAGQTVTITVANNGSGTQRLSALNVTVANALTGDPWTPPYDCSAADFTVTQPTFTAQDIPAGGSFQTTATLTMINRPVNQDGCKNITVPMRIYAS